MFTISEEIAIAIVYMCEERVGCKVGITDPFGKIIAKNPELGESRAEQAANLSIRRGQLTTLTIDENQTMQVLGMPLIIESRVLGAICIEGETSLLNNTKSLIVGFVHQILEKNVLIENFRQDSWNLKELLLHLVKEPLSPMISYLCKKFDINLQQSSRVILVEWSNFTKINEDIITSILKKSLKSDLFALDYPGRIVWVIQNDISDVTVSELYRSIKTKLSSQHIKTEVLLFVGADTISAGGFPESYNSAIQLVTMGKMLDRPWMYFEHHILTISLLQQENTWYGKQLRTPMKKLYSEDKKNQLIKTLRAYILCNGEINRCADNIVIHRNTLRYRLDKVYEITGLNPHNFQELFTLFAGMVMFERKGYAKKSSVV